MGSGKSTALDALARLGALTLSTDAVVHSLYEQQHVVDQLHAGRLLLLRGVKEIAGAEGNARSAS